MKPIVSIIAAISKDRALGKDKHLLWHIPEDLKRFKFLTKNHVVIMGRKTYESIGAALPERTNIVVSRDVHYQAAGCVVVDSLSEALRLAAEKEKNEIFIIGGGQIYTDTIHLADKLYLTIVEGEYQADTFFPDYSEFSRTIKQEKRSSDKYTYIFLELEREKKK